MKTFKYLAFMLAMLACCVNFVGCSSDDDDDSENPLVGTWETTESTYINGLKGHLMLTFGGERGTLTAIYDNGTDSDSYNFEYTLRTDSDGNSYITIIWTGSRYLIYSEGEHNFKLTSSKLKLGNYTYTRR